MNRDDLKELSRIRLEEARVLLENGKYDGAYYLCGYAVECGLKACIAKQTKQYDFPDRKTVNQSYTHDFTVLVGVAGLELMPSKYVDHIDTTQVLWYSIYCGDSHLQSASS